MIIINYVKRLNIFVSISSNINTFFLIQNHISLEFSLELLIIRLHGSIFITNYNPFGLTERRFY